MPDGAMGTEPAVRDKQRLSRRRGGRSVGQGRRRVEPHAQRSLGGAAGRIQKEAVKASARARVTRRRGAQ